MNKSCWYLTLSIHRYFGHSYKQYLNITNRPETRNNTTKMGGIKFTTDSDLMILSSGDFCGLLKNRYLFLQERLGKGRRVGERGSLKSYLRLMLLARSQTLVVQLLDVFYSFWKILRLFFFSNILLHHLGRTLLRHFELTLIIRDFTLKTFM